MVMLHFSESEAWKKTPYQIIRLFGYHKEYNQHIFEKESSSQRNSASMSGMDDIDIALGGL